MNKISPKAVCNKNKKKAKKIFLFTIAFMIMTSCATVNRSGIKDYRKKENVRRNLLSHSLEKSVNSAYTYIPLAATMILIGFDLDEKITEWSATTTPVFGSGSNARVASDNLRKFLSYEMILSSIIRLNVNEYSNKQKLTLIGSQIAEKQLSQNTVALIKNVSGRTRPDESDSKSFPSGHTSSAFANAFIINQNINSLSMDKNLKHSIQALNLILASSVAYARIEGNKHYPSDVLMSITLSHFFSTLINSVVSGPNGTKDFGFSPGQVKDDPGIRFNWDF